MICPALLAADTDAESNRIINGVWDMAWDCTGSSSLRLQRGNVAEFYGVLRSNPRGVHTRANMTRVLELRDIEGLGGTEVWKGSCV